MSVERQFQTWEAAVTWLRDQPDRNQLVKDAFYDDPITTAAMRYEACSEWQAVSRLLQGRGGRALDVGAGRGIASFALARQGFSVSALEPDGSAIVGAAAIRKLAADTNLPIEVVQEFSEHLPFADGTFDVVFARAVLHHTKDLDLACKEMYRVLRRGGVLIAAREHVISKAGDLEVFLARHPLHHLYGGENAYLLERYVDALTGGGFATVQILGPLTNPINLFPHTRMSLRDAAINRLSQKLPATWLWKAMLRSDWAFKCLLSIAEQFDRRPGRLYSFVAYKEAP